MQIHGGLRSGIVRRTTGMLQPLARLSAWSCLWGAALGVCPAQFLTAPVDGAAQAVQITGQVSLMRDSQPWAIKVGDWVPPRRELFTGPDGFAVFRLQDGSTFELYPNSTATFRANSGNFTDLLDLWIGRVRVHIQKLTGGQPNPNKVSTPTALISVRGTIFDVQVEDNGDITQVAVEEGQVAVQHALLPYTDPKLLNAGDFIRVYKHEPIARARIDRHALVERIIRAFNDPFMRRMPKIGGSGGGVPGSGPTAGPSIPGDTQAPAPPPPPPPPPPPGS